MSKPKRSPMEGQASSTSAQLEKTGAANQGEAQNTLGQFEGPVTSSPFYKSLLTSGTEATADAYNNAKTQMRDSSKAAGFNYTNPAEEGGEAELAGQEAQQMAELPGKTAIEATGPALQAAGETANIGNQQQQTGLGYETGVAVPLEQTYQQSQQAFWDSLLGMPAKTASGVGGLLTGIGNL